MSVPEQEANTQEEDRLRCQKVLSQGALGKQSGPLHIVNSFRRKKELEEKILQLLPTSTKTRILFLESAIGVFDKARFRHETSYVGCN
jgi:hypothetical protein